MNYVYLIQSLENSHYKIGVSKTPILRMKQLDTGNPSPTKLIEQYPSEFAYKIEKVLHNRYSYSRIKNKEWFELSINEEITFLDNCKKIEDTIKSLKKMGNPFI